MRTPNDFGGNEIVEKLGPEVYAYYAHLQTGSVMAKPGQPCTPGK